MSTHTKIALTCMQACIHVLIHPHCCNDYALTYGCQCLCLKNVLSIDNIWIYSVSSVASVTEIELLVGFKRRNVMSNCVYCVLLVLVYLEDLAKD